MLRTLIIAFFMLSTAMALPAVAEDFMTKESCTLTFTGKVPLHTTCLIKGGIQDVGVDVSIRTPDGKTYKLDGPIDGEEGHKYLLQNRPATKSIDGACYSRNDGLLEICIGT
jgi:hypothetical protein